MQACEQRRKVAAMSQRRMGPAPFASFEDLSDENDTPAVNNRLPDIREHTQPIQLEGATSCLQTPSTPRIDISRASSSSHHEEDSRDSTPERELFGPQCTRLGIAFTEDGAMDLRSSTEELDFQDPDAQPKPPKDAGTSVATSQDTSGLPSNQLTRKDSGGSELGFLSVSGRTSRLSSIGSQGSRASNASGASGMSRSPSPHKMLLETSFCGTKSSEQTVAVPPGGSDMEQALLSRRPDPTEAVLAEGISIEMRKKIQPVNGTSPKRQIPTAIPIVVEPSSQTDDEIDQPMSPGKTIVAESGVEYTYIPLKGPLPTNMLKKPTINRSRPITAPRKSLPNKQIKSPTTQQKKLPENPITKPQDPQYIRIKLKPDHMYTDTDGSTVSSTITVQADVTANEINKPASLNLNNGRSPPASAGSPKLPRLRETAAVSRTPSPSVSRKSSFTSLFRSKEAIISSPESPCDRSRSKSKEREHKSVFGIFKPKKSCIKKQTSPETVPVTSPLPSLEFKFNSQPSGASREKLKYYETPLEGDSIRIPLHSPGTEPEPLPLYLPTPPASPTPGTSKKIQETESTRETLKELEVSRSSIVDKGFEEKPRGSIGDTSQEALRGATIDRKESVEKSRDSFEDKFENHSIPRDVSRHSFREVSREGLRDTPRDTSRDSFKETPRGTPLGTPRGTPQETFQPGVNLRHSSTSSENITFTTNLGSNNEIFTTKLPKDKSHRITENHCEKPVDNRRVIEKKTERPMTLTRSESSESERDLTETTDKNDGLVKEDEHELKTLVFQQDSFEDEELPYVPTTLPLERSVAIPIVPIKQRGEIKMCPIERPRSTTPINPNCLEDYSEDVIVPAEAKLRINLPKDDVIQGKGKSARKWQEFAEKDMGITGGSSSPPPPLPPRGVQKDWINFEEVPEKRKPPKKIQVLPSTSNRGSSVVEDVMYVNPEDCKCECHEQTPRNLKDGNKPTDAFPNHQKLSS